MFVCIFTYTWASLVAQMVKESACNARDLGSIPGSERFPGGGHGNPFPYYHLENPHGQRSLAARKQSSLSGKESAQGCIPKRLLGRPD